MDGYNLADYLSVISFPIAIFTLYVAQKLASYITGERLAKRLTAILGDLRTAQFQGDVPRQRAQLRLMLSAVYQCFGWTSILLSRRVRTFYFAVRSERDADMPDIAKVEGYLQNFRSIHADLTP